jgi:flagellar secretion chaperone FliS
MQPSSSVVRQGRACQQYQTLDLASRLETASPHRLVAILYEEMLLAVEILERAARKGRDVRFHPQTDRMRSILISLESGLDFENGGTLAHSLAQVYRSMRRELVIAVNSDDAKAFGALREGVQSVATAWASIDD